MAEEAKSTNARRGKYVGDCPKCSLMLASFDERKGKYVCPRCGATK